MGLGPSLTVADVVSVTAFRKLPALLYNFKCKTIPALKESRRRSKMIAFLPLLMLQRCRCCCASLKRWGSVGNASADVIWCRICNFQWRHIGHSFTSEMMDRWDPLYRDTVCYLPITTLVRLSDAPCGSDARGWAWVSFQVPYGVEAFRAGWVHPDIFDTSISTPNTPAISAPPADRCRGLCAICTSRPCMLMRRHYWQPCRCAKAMRGENCWSSQLICSLGFRQ